MNEIIKLGVCYCIRVVSWLYPAEREREQLLFLKMSLIFKIVEDARKS